MTNDEKTGSIEFTADAEYVVATPSGRGAKRMHAKGDRLLDIPLTSCRRWIRRGKAKLIVPEPTIDASPVPPLPPAAPQLPPVTPTVPDAPPVAGADTDMTQLAETVAAGLRKIRDNALNPKRRMLVYQGIEAISGFIEEFDITDDSRMVLMEAAKEFDADGTITTIQFEDLRDAVMEIVGATG